MFVACGTHNLKLYKSSKALEDRPGAIFNQDRYSEAKKSAEVACLIGHESSCR